MMSSTVRLTRGNTIGWIGLGAMGHPMALNLFTKSYLAQSATPPSFAICEADPSRLSSFLSELRNRGGSELSQRVTPISSGREMALAASRIITMLPSTPHVEAVYLDPSSGILAGLRDVSSDEAGLRPPPLAASTWEGVSDRGEAVGAPPPGVAVEDATGELPTGEDIPVHTLLIDQTTLDPTAARAVAARIHTETDGRVAMVDAPVSGGTVAAAAGSLTIMFGSPSPLASALAVPLLERMAREGGVIPCGGSGTGVGVKVCNNMILAINQIALSEGLALGNSLGIDPTLLHNVINSSSGQSWSSRVNSPLSEIHGSPGSRGYSGGFQSRLMLKDIGLALHAAHEYDLPTPLSWAAKSVYDSVCSEGDGDWASKDFSVVFEWLKRKQAEGVERGWKDGAPPAGTS